MADLQPTYEINFPSNSKNNRAICRNLLEDIIFACYGQTMKFI